MPQTRGNVLELESPESMKSACNTTHHKPVRVFPDVTTYTSLPSIHFDVVFKTAASEWQRECEGGWEREVDCIWAPAPFPCGSRWTAGCSSEVGEIFGMKPELLANIMNVTMHWITTLLRPSLWLDVTIRLSLLESDQSRQSPVTIGI